MTWVDVRDNAQNVVFNYFKEPLRLQLGNEVFDPIDAVLDTTQSKLKIPNTDGSYTISAQLFVFGRDIGAPPEVDEKVKVNDKTYLVKFCDDTTDLYEIHLEAAGF